MVSITHNESRAVNLLLRDFANDHNINQIAKELSLSPRGAYKILKKLENNKILTAKKVGNSIIYKINFENESTPDICQFVLTERKTTPYTQAWMNDLEPLKEVTELAILFGSVLEKGKQANDIDVFLVFERKWFNKVQQKIKEINMIKTKKLHPIMQTKQDLIQNIKKKDQVILKLINTGTVLWGRNILVEAVKDGQN